MVEESFLCLLKVPCALMAFKNANDYSFLSHYWCIILFSVIRKFFVALINNLSDNVFSEEKYGYLLSDRASVDINEALDNTQQV